MVEQLKEILEIASATVLMDFMGITVKIHLHAQLDQMDKLVLMVEVPTVLAQFKVVPVDA
jgi:hypothetical protein